VKLYYCHQEKINLKRPAQLYRHAAILPTASSNPEMTNLSCLCHQIVCGGGLDCFSAMADIGSINGANRWP